MRIAIVSDIHGNRTAFEAVLADLRQTSPDLILHGGDLPHGGASPAEIVDQVRDLGWPGVVGNTDEMLWMPESLTEFASQSPHMQPLLAAIAEMAQFDRDALGEERLAWLRGLPRLQVHGPLALVHASPESLWRAPGPEAGDAELESVYGPLGQPIAVYGHIHRSYIRRVSGITVVNAGSVSLSYDGDRRAAYLLLDDAEPTIRRVEYDVDRELKSFAGCGLPHADWMARLLNSASPRCPNSLLKNPWRIKTGQVGNVSNLRTISCPPLLRRSVARPRPESFAPRSVRGILADSRCTQFHFSQSG